MGSQEHPHAASLTRTCDTHPSPLPEMARRGFTPNPGANTSKKPTISFSVEGEPKAQPRPRAFARKMGNTFVARVYDAATAEGWKSLIAVAARPHLPPSPLEGPLELVVSFFMPRPRSHYGSGKNAQRLKDSSPRYHIGKPDLDNLIKAVKDALTQIGMWNDDGQVMMCITSKEWRDTGGADIIIATGASAVCHKCGREMCKVSGGTGNVTNDGKLWCGC